MATKKFLELKEFSNEDLIKEIKDSEVQYEKLVFDHSVQGLENPLRIRELRRDIARLKTESRRRELEGADESVIAGRSRIRARRRKK